MTIPPLAAVYEWYNGLSYDVKVDLAALSKFIHPDTTMLNLFGTDQLLEGFSSYLLGDGLTNKEVFKRTVLIVAVIEWAMEDRASNAGWEKSVDTLLDMRNHFREDDMRETIDDMLSKHPSRKEEWLNVAQSWETLRSSILSRKNINDWFVSTLS